MSRKEDHLELTVKSQVNASNLDSRFDYEPMLSSHPSSEDLNLSQSFLGKNFKYPLWFSSMTGGAKEAKVINTNMAKVARKFSLGMGLGSCRPILDGNDALSDFKIRDHLGDDRPLYANLGIAQVERLVEARNYNAIVNVVKKVEADGLIVHINPLQEWFQPEGDRFQCSPVDTVKRLVDKLDIKIIVKEVGHGFGLRSLHELNKIPLVAIELSGFGGTNFSQLEALRNEGELHLDTKVGLINVGHTATDMIDSINAINAHSKGSWKPDVIISGGVKGPLDAYYLKSKLQANSLIGQAASVLKHARISEESLEQYVQNFIDTYSMAKSFLKVRS